MSASSRIVGGEEATPHSYPWMAALFVDDQWFCGGLYTVRMISDADISQLYGTKFSTDSLYLTKLRALQ